MFCNGQSVSCESSLALYSYDAWVAMRVSWSCFSHSWIKLKPSLSPSLPPSLPPSQLSFSFSFSTCVHTHTQWEPHIGTRTQAISPYTHSPTNPQGLTLYTIYLMHTHTRTHTHTHTHTHHTHTHTHTHTRTHTQLALDNTIQLKLSTYIFYGARIVWKWKSEFHTHIIPIPTYGQTCVHPCTRRTSESVCVPVKHELDFSYLQCGAV